ncbi:MAG TPA: O-methyltransferase [Gemmatimonadales bacterium]|nr:O-methyltransferase [Gemmatimonadales bacterium]
MTPPLSALLTRYLEGLVPPRPPELARMEAEAARTEFPIIGPVAGQFCYLVARLIGARRVFELGSGFGYSTAWFARAVRENGGGQVYHVVWDAALSARARRHLAALGLGDLIRYEVDEAVRVLRRTDGPFDLIFNDIDKAGYPASLGPIREKLRPGGVLVVDNLLWGGKVFDPADRSPETEGVRRLTEEVFGDPRWIASLVPIRDGLLVALNAG